MAEVKPELPDDIEALKAMVMERDATIEQRGHHIEQLERIGVELPRATLASWMVRSGELITPVINLLRGELLDQAYIHMDETTVQVLKEPGRAPESKSYLWAQRNR